MSHKKAQKSQKEKFEMLDISGIPLVTFVPFVAELTFVLCQDTKSGTRDVAQPGSAHAWGA